MNSSVSAHTGCASNSLRDIEIEISQTGQLLTSSFRRLIEALPVPLKRPNDLASALKVHQVLASKILRAVDKRDPLAAAHVMPGPEALRKLLHAASEFPLDKSVLDEAAIAIERFEHLLDNVVDGRSELDAILSQWVPETRRQIEASSRQASHKAMSSLRGVVTGLSVNTTFLHPSERSGESVRYDAVDCISQIGARRIRPGALMQVRISLSSSACPLMTSSLDGTATSDNEQALLLREFSSDVPVRVTHDPDPSTTMFIIDDDRVGVRSSADLCFGMRWDGLAVGSERRYAMGTHIDIPTKRLIVDAFIHKDVKLDGRPEMIAYDTVPRGWVKVKDLTPDICWDLLEPIQMLGQGATSISIADFPRYSDMIRHVCAARSWNVEKFIGYRCQINYPVYGSDYMMVFRIVP